MPYLKKCLQFSPLVGIVGHRQVGKTTLISLVGQAYYTLDDEESIAYLVSSATEFIREVAGPTPVAIDEAQLMPELFPALKEHVRKKKRPGQFLISGSVRFTSLKSIRESLTGRIITLELLPFSINELIDLEPAQWLHRIHHLVELNQRNTESMCDKVTRRKIHSALQVFREMGGLPGICFIRNDKIRRSKLKTQLDTILDRDLRQVVSTRLSLNELSRMMSILAKNQGSPIPLKTVSFGKRMNAASVRALLAGFEALFLIRSIPVRGDYSGSVYIFEDIAEYRHALEQEPTKDDLDLIVLFQIIRAAFSNSYDDPVDFFQFRTRGGSVVPLVAQTKSGITGFIPITDEAPSKANLAAARSFLAKYPRSKLLFCGSNVKAVEMIDERRMTVPFEVLCL